MGRTPAGQTRERVYRFLRKQLLSGRPPTVRDVQHAFGFRAVETAREHLEALVREGRLAKEAGVARGFRLPSRTAVPTALVPVLGRVQAGALTEAIQDPDGYVPVGTGRSPERLFALTVRGESMTGAGILPGDLVIVRRQSTARSGEIVVAQIDGEATVKRLKLRGRRVELHPENPAFDVILAGGGEREVTILGRVIEVRRSLEGRGGGS